MSVGWSDWWFFSPSSAWLVGGSYDRNTLRPPTSLPTRNGSISNGGMLSNYGCVISYRHQAAYHFDNTTVTSNNRSYLCNGNERHLSDCSIVLNDQCSQNASVYIHCQGETKFTSFFSPSLFYAVVDVGSPPPPPPTPPFFLSFFFLLFLLSLQDLEQMWVDGNDQC